MESEIPAQQPSADRRFPGFRPGRIALYVLLLLVIAVVVSAFIQLPDEAIVPGTAMSVSSLISVPKAEQHHTAGTVLLVDVELVPLRAINYLFYRWNHDDQVVPTSQLTGNESQLQYDEQGVLQMATAQQAATVVALRHLGYPVTARPSAVVIYQLEPQAPSNLSVGEIVRAVDGHPVSTLTELHDQLIGAHPGQRLTLTTQKFASKGIGHTVVTLGEVVDAGKSAEHCSPVPARSARTPGGPACIGVFVDQLYTTQHEPFRVGLSAEGIIGPSAGLAFTLGLIQALDPGNLTGGRKIAATGTISLNGAVGDVGGVAQKTIAVRRSGASIFFIPKVEYPVAKAEAGSHLQIVPVTNINQVLSYLEAHGGKLVTKDGE